MDQQREQASQIAHEFIVYQESEQADIDAKDHQFDATSLTEFQSSKNY